MFLLGKVWAFVLNVVITNCSSSSKDNASKSKRTRTTHRRPRLKPKVKFSLKEFFNKLLNNHYPDKEKKAKLAAEVGITTKQVTRWFVNERIQWRRENDNKGMARVKARYCYHEENKGAIEDSSSPMEEEECENEAGCECPGACACNKMEGNHRPKSPNGHHDE